MMNDPPSTGLGRRCTAFYDRNRGLAYVFVAQLFGVLMNVTTRLLEIEGNSGNGMHPFQILFVRMIITTTLSTLYMWWAKITHFPFGVKEVRLLLLVRGVGGFLGVFGMYYSLLYLPLADATVLTFITPSLSCWICSIMIKEPFTRMEQAGALLSFVGVTMIAKPLSLFHQIHTRTPPSSGTDHAPASHSHKIGVADLATVSPGQRIGAICIALIGVCGSAMAFVAMRWIGRRAHPLLSVNYFCALCTVVSAAAIITLPSVPMVLPAGLREWSYLVFLGLCGFIMQFLLSAGLQHEKSSRATLMVYFQMVWALIFDEIVFGNKPSILSFLGSSLITASAIYVALQKQSIKQRQEAEKAAHAAEATVQAIREDIEVARARSSSLGYPVAARMDLSKAADEEKRKSTDLS